MDQSMQDQSKQKTVSVVITTHNRPDYLKESLASVLNQTVKPSELYVIDDGSTVSYEEVLAQFPQEQFTYVKVPVASGANAARNLGITKSTSDIIAFLDDDDIWDTDYLERHISMHQKADAVTLSLIHISEPTRRS